MKYTSAAANKQIKLLNEKKEFHCQIEANSKTYVAAVDEEPVIPAFDYAKNAAEIEKIDLEIVKIKHAINLSNALASIEVCGRTMSVDEILVRLAQLSNRLDTLGDMRSELPKSRVESMGARTVKPEYRYVNYDLDAVRADYDKTAQMIAEMQLALDKYNQTFEFEVED